MNPDPHAPFPAEPARRWPSLLRRLLHRWSPAGRWAAVLAALQAAGSRHGRYAAAWWQQDTIGGRATGQVKPTAARVLAGLHNLDPAILDTLPALQVDDGLYGRIYTEHAGPAAPPWQRLSPARRVQAIDAYHDAYDMALHAHVAAYCQQVLDTDPAASRTTGRGSGVWGGEPL